MSDIAKCELCGEPMPPGEQMFNYHGYSGPCPKPPKPKEPVVDPRDAELARLRSQYAELKESIWRCPGDDDFDPAEIVTCDHRKTLAQAIDQAAAFEAVNNHLEHIARLRSLCEDAAAALRPFAGFIEHLNPGRPDNEPVAFAYKAGRVDKELYSADFRRAAAVLARHEAKAKTAGRCELLG